MNRTICFFTMTFLLATASLTTQAQVKILIAYYSKEGHTAALARAVADGAASFPGTTVKLLRVEEVTNIDLLEADAIMVGSPVYNANVAPAVSEFITRWPFEGAPLKNKIGAAFVTGGGISAGEEVTQLSILHSMLIFGMIIVGGPSWEQPFGASAITGEDVYRSADKGVLNPIFLRKGTELGRRVAEVASRFK